MFRIITAITKRKGESDEAKGRGLETKASR